MIGLRGLSVALGCCLGAMLALNSCSTQDVDSINTVGSPSSDVGKQEVTLDSPTPTGIVRITIVWPAANAQARDIPSNTDRIEVVAAGNTGVGEGVFTIAQTVRSSDVVNGQVSIELQLPIGVGHVIAAEAYGAGDALLAVGSTTVVFSTSSVGEARLLMYGAGDTLPSTPSPGRVIAFARATSSTLGAERRIYAIAPEGENERMISHADDAECSLPALSPGATRLIYAGPGAEILQISLAGGNTVSMTDVNSVTAGDDVGWSRTGELIAFVRGGDIYVARPDGALPRNVTNTANVRERHPSFSPDGTRICFHLAEGVSEYGNIGTVNVDGSGYDIITTSLTAGSTDWAPEGDEIVFHQVSPGLAMEMELYITDQSGEAPTKIDFADQTQWASSFPKWSPDGKYIAFVRDSRPSAGQTDLWRVERADITNLVQLTDTPSMPEMTLDWK